MPIDVDRLTALCTELEQIGATAEPNSPQADLIQSLVTAALGSLRAVARLADDSDTKAELYEDNPWLGFDPDNPLWASWEDFDRWCRHKGWSSKHRMAVANATGRITGVRTGVEYGSDPGFGLIDPAGLNVRQIVRTLKAHCSTPAEKAALKYVLDRVDPEVLREAKQQLGKST